MTRDPISPQEMGKLWSEAMVAAGLDLSKTYHGNHVERYLIAYLLREVKRLRAGVSSND